MQKYTRKLTRNGNSSLAVILPKPWLDYQGLEYGDLLEVITNDDIVTIKLKER